LLILDEAQAINNHAHKQTKALKALQARGRIAMTGAHPLRTAWPTCGRFSIFSTRAC